jgi:hypothetical protein
VRVSDGFNWAGSPEDPIVVQKGEAITPVDHSHVYQSDNKRLKYKDVAQDGYIVQLDIDGLWNESDDPPEEDPETVLEELEVSFESAVEVGSTHGISFSYTVWL